MIKDFIKENWILLLAVLYVLSPIDIIPDVIPIFGATDDAGVVLIELARRFSEHMKSDAEPKEEKDEKPESEVST